LSKEAKTKPFIIPFGAHAKQKFVHGKFFEDCVRQAATNCLEDRKVIDEFIAPKGIMNGLVLASITFSYCLNISKTGGFTRSLKNEMNELMSMAFHYILENK
jgi:hypothetical protein